MSVLHSYYKCPTQYNSKGLIYRDCRGHRGSLNIMLGEPTCKNTCFLILLGLAIRGWVNCWHNRCTRSARYSCFTVLFRQGLISLTHSRVYKFVLHCKFLLYNLDFQFFHKIICRGLAVTQDNYLKSMFTSGTNKVFNK